MKTTSTRNDNNTVTLTGTVDSATWSKACKNALNNLSKRANFKGFRNGKVPAGMIRKMYGKNAIEEMAADAMAKANLDAWVDAEDLTPIDRMTFEGHEVTEDGVVLTFTVPVAPKAVLGEWKNLGIAKDAVEVTDEEVDNVIENLRKNAAEEELVEEDGAAKGDRVSIEFTADVNGENDGKGTYKQVIELGRNDLIEAVDAALEGAKTGEAKDVDAVYPAGTMDKENDTNVTFHVTVGEIFRPVLPELNDEFAATVEQYEKPATVEELKNAVRTSLTNSKEEAAEDKYIAELLEAVRKNVELTVPQNMIVREVEATINNMARSYAAQGIKLEDVLKYSGMTIDQLAGGYMGDAERRVANTLILDAIAEAEGLSVTDEEVENELKEFAEENNLTVDQVKQNLNMKDFRHSLLDDKAMDVLLAAQENASAE